MKVKVVLSTIIDTESDGSVWGIEDALDDMPSTRDYDVCLKELFMEDILSLLEGMVWDIRILDNEIEKPGGGGG